jgi:hypothetical protein
MSTTLALSRFAKDRGVSWVVAADVGLTKSTTIKG